MAWFVGVDGGNTKTLALLCDERGEVRHEVGRVEADEEPVAGRGDLLAAVGCEHLTEGRVVPAEHRFPGLIAERLNEVRRADDIGIQYSCQHPVCYWRLPRSCSRFPSSRFLPASSQVFGMSQTWLSSLLLHGLRSISLRCSMIS